MACGKEKEIEKILSLAREKIAKDLDIVDKNNLHFAGLSITLCMS